MMLRCPDNGEYGGENVGCNLEHSFAGRAYDAYRTVAGEIDPTRVR
jgi:hypothetical protein